MPDHLPPLPPLEAQPPETPVTSTPPEDDRPVSIPLEDVTRPVEMVDQAAIAAEAARLTMLRNQHRPPTETVEQYNERVKREFTEQVLAARREAERPPPPTQPVPRGISEQTAREMAAGAKQSAYWAEQQKFRPPPNEHDLRAAGRMAEVFAPDRYTHEKGVGVSGKDYSSTNLPGR